MAKKRTRSNGEGTIYHNGKYWVGQATIGQDPQSGKPKRKSIYGKTKREVSEKLVEIQNELNKGIFTDPTNATVKEWTLYWLENFKKNQLNGTTYENYQYKLNKHIIEPFGNIKFKNLTTYHIQEYINKLKSEGFSSSYIKSLKNTFNSMFKQAVKLDAIAKNPCDNLLLPKTDIKKQLQVLTKDEHKKFVDYCNNNDEFLFIFMLGTGVRISEALGLAWECVDFENDIINISNIIVEYKGVPRLQEYAKTEESVRDIPMSEKIKEILLKLRSNQEKSNMLNLVLDMIQ